MTKVARIYLRVSTEAQDLERQEEAIVAQARNNGYYVAGVYREKTSGALLDRPELNRVIAERMDRISRLPLPEAEKLIKSIQDTGARLSVPGVLDLSELATGGNTTARIVLDAVQSMLLRLALQMVHEDYETRRERQRQGIEAAKENGRNKGQPSDSAMHQRILALRASGHSIANTAALAGCSVSQVKRITAANKSL